MYLFVSKCIYLYLCSFLLLRWSPFCVGGFTGDVYLLIKLLLPGAGKKRVYNIQSKQMVKILSQVLHVHVPPVSNPCLYTCKLYIYLYIFIYLAPRSSVVVLMTWLRI